MKEKICIVPFTKTEFPILRNLNMRYEIAGLVSPRGIGNPGEDVCVLRNTELTGFKFAESKPDAFNNSSVIIISNIEKADKTLYEYAKSSLLEAVKGPRKVISFLEIDATLKRDLLQLADKSGCSVKFMCDLYNEGNAKYANQSDLYEFPVPIFFVSGLLTDCDRYEVFLNLARKFREKGKRVLALSSNPYNFLFDYPVVNWNAHKDLPNLVMHLNSFLYSLYKAKMPDVILVDLPYPVMQYNKRNIFDSGLSAYFISQALGGDGCVICAPYNAPTGDFWKEFGKSILTKLGYPILAVHISNCLPDPISQNSSAIVHVPAERIKENIASRNLDSDLAFFNLLSEEELDKIVQRLLFDFIDPKVGVI